MDFRPFLDHCVRHPAPRVSNGSQTGVTQARVLRPWRMQAMSGRDELLEMRSTCLPQPAVLALGPMAVQFRKLVTTLPACQGTGAGLL